MKPSLADSPAWQPEWVSQLLEQDSLHRHTKASCICCNDGWGPPELHLQNAVPAQMANCWETVARLLEMGASRHEHIFDVRLSGNTAGIVCLKTDKESG